MTCYYRHLWLGGLLILGCSESPKLISEQEAIALRPTHVLSSIWSAEDGTCWQFLTGGMPYLGETYQGKSLNGVAAIEVSCP